MCFVGGGEGFLLHLRYLGNCLNGPLSVLLRIETVAVRASGVQVVYRSDHNAEVERFLLMALAELDWADEDFEAVQQPSSSAGASSSRQQNLNCFCLRDACCRSPL